jgi:hypothetical protein
MFDRELLIAFVARCNGVSNARFGGAAKGGAAVEATEP